MLSAIEKRGRYNYKAFTSRHDIQAETLNYLSRKFTKVTACSSVNVIIKKSLNFTRVNGIVMFPNVSTL